jgi:RNA polymerase sigma factor (sigma-70 family)
MSSKRPRLLRLEPPSSAAPGERSDDELMTLAQAGMRDAFAVLVKRHATRVIRVCSKLVNDAALGEELAQETWLAVYAARAKYHAEGRFVVWLLTAARNRCRNHLRHHRVTRLHREVLQSEPAVLSDDQVERLLREERGRRVHDALAHLPERLREALILRYAEDLRYDEMAEVLAVGESTLRSRVHHGLRQLRAWLESPR